MTEEIFHGSTANGRAGGIPPLTNSTIQTGSSKIQAQFAAQVAARVRGEKGKQIGEKKAEDTRKDKDGQASTAQIDETKKEENIQGKWLYSYKRNLCQGFASKQYGNTKQSDQHS